MTERKRKGGERAAVSSAGLLAIGLLLMAFLAAPAMADAPFGDGELIADNYATALGRMNLFAGDLNGDMHDDLIFTGTLSRIYVCYGQGEGKYGDPEKIYQQQHGGGDVLIAQPADMDDDGDLDILLAHSDYMKDGAQYYGKIIVLLNGYGPTPAWTEQVILDEQNTHTSSLRLSVGDLNGDGYGDFLYTREALKVDDTTTYTKTYVVMNDGDQVNNTSGAPGSDYKWDGTFTTTELYSADSSAMIICLGAHAADLDGDGDDDALFGMTAFFGPGSALYKAINDGTGTFGAPEKVADLAGGASSISTPDMDGDGNADILVSTNGGFGNNSEVSWIPGNGDGTFDTANKVTLISVAVVTGIDFAMAADLDADCDLDVVTDNGAETVVWYDNTAGDASAFAAAKNIQADSGSSTACVLDDDVDGDLDVFVGKPAKIYRYENQTSAVSVPVLGEKAIFSYDPDSPSRILMSNSSRHFVLDMDKDGDQDIVALGSNHQIGWWANDGAGGFGMTNMKVIGAKLDDSSTTSSLSDPLDIDGDGDLDFFSAHGPRNHQEAGLVRGRVFWHENTIDVNGGWTTHTIDEYQGDSQGTIGLAAGDFNGDNYPDVLISQGGYASAGTPMELVLYLNNDSATPGSFGASANVYTYEQINPMSMGASFSGFKTGDFNGDTNVDLMMFVAESYMDMATFSFVELSPVFVLPGAGDGTFGARYEVLDKFMYAYSGYSNVQFEDVNQDGITDILGAGSEAQMAFTGVVQYYPGDGAGKYGDPVVLARGGQFYTWASLGDIDNDGSPELLAGTQDNLSFHSAIYYKLQCGKVSSPARVFHSVEGSGGGEKTSGLHVADFNGDGENDMLFCGKGLSIIGGNPTAVARTADDVKQDPDKYGGNTLTYGFNPITSTLTITGTETVLPFYPASEDGSHPATPGNWVGVAVKIPDGVDAPGVRMQVNSQELTNYQTTDDGWILHYFKPQSGDTAPAATLDFIWGPYPVKNITIAVQNDLIMWTNDGCPRMWGGEEHDEQAHIYAGGFIALGEIPDKIYAASDQGNEFAGAILRCDGDFAFRQSVGAERELPIRKLRLVAEGKILIHGYPKIAGYGDLDDFGFDADFGSPCPAPVVKLGALNRTMAEPNNR